MTTPPRPPITCHILDTTTGRPAPSIPTTLTSLTATPLTYTALTNPDGRVTAWTPAPATPDLRTTFDKFAAAGAPTLWEVRFETGAYFEGKGVSPFFPEVTVRFQVGEYGEHYHVPLLVGPFTYTTYRGS
ncbi:Hydroxyisourate hydrolase [Eremomyces bilateralis CBS 781.70]|uniref:5-hydroxyisourate hydrolase n=1 Tax=Eremomyces bilateralis CBS 781.70 TaxID=1392243 RepID=A0A6G1G1E3_9PEZI|nr:Hydroxyisourate hydrolase [Eremomyces bilateralis CBS 781.70]KAF1811874.1 Hydroxyisourate hydrolase [Eremomyces bilateralis CBS 781.70]